MAHISRDQLGSGGISFALYVLAGGHSKVSKITKNNDFSALIILIHIPGNNNITVHYKKV